MKYVTLITLSLQHPYYTDGKCQDFAISATDDTLRLLNNHRCVLAIGRDSVRVACPVDDAGSPLIAFDSGTTLRFALQLRNLEFGLFTDLTGLAPDSTLPTPLFSNAAAAAGTTTDYALTLATQDAGTPYLPGIFANLDITLPEVASGTAWPSTSYSVSFTARQMYWAYYCFVDTSTDATTLHIVDASPSGTADVLAFSDTNRRDLTADPDSADTTGTQLSAQYSTLRCVRFTSDELITCSQTPRQYLELRQADERLMGPLPNPSRRELARDDLLFRIIKYRTQPLLTQ